MTALVLPSWLVLVLVIVASARTMRLAAYDSITQWIPKGIHRWATKPRRGGKKQPSWKQELFIGWLCPFCLGFWITLAWVASALAWADTVYWQLAAGALGLNYIQARLNARFEV